MKLEKKQSRRKEYDKLWRSQPFQYGCVKFILEPDKTQKVEILEYMKRHRWIFNKISREFYKMLKSGKLAPSDFWSMNYADDLWRDNMSFFEKNDFCFQRHRRGVGFHVQRAYKSYIKRRLNISDIKYKEGKKIGRKKSIKDVTAEELQKLLPKRPISLDQTKAVYIQDGIVKDKGAKGAKGVVGFAIPGKESGKYRKTDLIYKIPKGMLKKREFLNPNLGGNLDYKIKTGTLWYTANAVIPFNWSYEPVGPLAFDINKTGADFLVCSCLVEVGGKLTDHLPHTDQMIKIIARLRKLNKEIGKSTKSSQTRAIRRKVQSAHKAFKRLCVPYCTDLVNFAEKEKLLVCIDNLTCGGRTGTFGEDKVIEIIQDLCRRRRIPHLLVPTPYTSRMCCKCGKKGERPTTGLFVCKKCGKTDAQVNAARYIAQKGWKMWCRMEVFSND